MGDIFKEISEREKQLMDQLIACSIVDITGLVGVSGVGASKLGKDHLVRSLKSKISFISVQISPSNEITSPFLGCMGRFLQKSYGKEIKV
jgi:hypothetical protein